MDKKLIKKFSDKYSKKIILFPEFFIEELNKFYKNKKLFSLKKLNKKTKGILKTIFVILNSTFSKLFYENENMKSLKTPIIGPFYLDLKKKDWYIAYLKGNKLQIKNSLPFAMYNKKKKTILFF